MRWCRAAGNQGGTLDPDDLTLLVHRFLQNRPSAKDTVVRLD